MKVTLKEVGDLVDYYSSKSSEYSHQLGLAGIVLIWALYSCEKYNGFELIILLIVAFFLFILQIAISLVHYFVLALMCKKYYEKEHRRIELNTENLSVIIDDTKVEEPPLIDNLSWLFFKAKSILLFIAYFLILLFIIINLLKF